MNAVATAPANTRIDYYLSNNGGERWYQVRPGEQFCFPTAGSDLRWRVDLHSLSPALSPEIDTLSVSVEPVTDTDCDSITDDLDNCTLVPNPTQCNADGDAYGNHCDPDLDDSGNVNFLDLELIKAVFFSEDAVADLDCDGSVNFEDLSIMKSLFFGPPGPSGLARNSER